MVRSHAVSRTPSLHSLAGRALAFLAGCGTGYNIGHAVWRDTVGNEYSAPKGLPAYGSAKPRVCRPRRFKSPAALWPSILRVLVHVLSQVPVESAAEAGVCKCIELRGHISRVRVAAFEWLRSSHDEDSTHTPLRLS